MTRSAHRGTGLPVSTLAAYGLPSLPSTILTFPLFVLLPTYYAQDLGMGLGIVGAVLLGSRLWDAVTDPLIGALSDHISTRWGRRRPWIVAGTPIALVSAWFLLVPGGPVGWDYLLGWTIALYLGGTMILIPYNAWGAEISSHYHERARVTSFREIFVLIGGVTAAALAAALQADRAEALRVTAIIVIVALPIAVAVAVTVVPDRPASLERRLTFGRAIAVLRTNKPFQRLLAAFFLNSLANGFPITLFLLFVQHKLQADDTMVSWILGAYFALALLSVPFWLVLTKRYGKHRVWIGAMLMVCAFFIWVPFLGAGDGWWLLIISIFTGFGLGADLVLPPAMQADVVDLDELRHREKRTGIFFAIWSIALKLSLALAAGIAFPILELVDFQRVVGDNGPAALLTLAILYAIVPVVFKLASIALMWRFPITSAKQAQIRRLITARERRA
ncbi:MAG: MFS transporter [Proteobacteria bacterium]|nr:MFS transporter [Pseudomonadota bacterium]MDA1057426.1 MFS transporter [Pseudomonadota bacterium]